MSSTPRPRCQPFRELTMCSSAHGSEIWWHLAHSRKWRPDHKAKGGFYDRAHWSSCARKGGRINQLTADQQADYAQVNLPCGKFSLPQQRIIASQNFLSTQQNAGESSAAFAVRLINMDRAVCPGQDNAVFKKRLLEEYVSRLRGNNRYFCTTC